MPPPARSGKAGAAGKRKKKPAMRADLDKGIEAWAVDLLDVAVLLRAAASEQQPGDVQGVCKHHRLVILNRGFRWARATYRWVHLTRDDHAQ